MLPISITSSNNSNRVSQEFKIEELGKKIIDSITPSLPDLSKMRQIEMPETVKERLIASTLEQLAKKAEGIFKTPNDALFDSPEFQEFMSKGFLSILTSIVKEAEQLPPNTIAECGVDEAVFTHALDPKPIAATDSLATCIGVAGYERQDQFGFVIHFASEAALESSKEMLIEKMMQMSKKPMNNPIEIHLRGGIAGLSEPLLEAIEKWIKLASVKGCPMTIMSKDVLTKGLINESGIPNTMSISLDTRNGTLNTYDSSTNPYAKQKIQISNAKELDDIFTKVFIDTAVKKSEIKITYFAP